MMCFQGKTIAKVARNLFVSHSTIERVIHLYRTTGEVAYSQEKHGPYRILSEAEDLTLLQLFLNNPGIFLREVQEELAHASGKWADYSTICRSAKRLGLTRQKMKKIAIPRSDILRAEYMADIGI